MRKLTHEEISSRRTPPDAAGTMKRHPIIGLLDNIRSLYNVGSIFRTSDGGSIQELFLCGYTPHPPRKEIEKTALGSTRTVPWRPFRSSLDGIAAARDAGFRICVLEQTTESRLCSQVTPADFPVCLVVGNEITGVAAGVIAAADMAVEIPMFGTKQSLNASVAYGIALFGLISVLTDHMQE